MTPQTVHRIAQEIRHLRGLLTSDIKWTLDQPHSQLRKEYLDRVAFWRDVLNHAERKIASGEISTERTSPFVSKG